MVINLKEYLEKVDKDKDFLRFLAAITKLSPIEIFGLARIMGIPFDENKSGEDLICDMLDKFIEESRCQRRYDWIWVAGGEIR